MTRISEDPKGGTCHEVLADASATRARRSSSRFPARPDARAALNLQRSAGNAAVARLAARRTDVSSATSAERAPAVAAHVAVPDGVPRRAYPSDERRLADTVTQRRQELSEPADRAGSGPAQRAPRVRSGMLARQPAVADEQASPYFAGVVADGVALRSSPAGPRPRNRFHNFVASLNRDVYLVVEGRQGKWMRVRVDSGTALERLTNRPTSAAGLTGYVSAELLVRREAPRPSTIDPAHYSSFDEFSAAWPDRVTAVETLERLWNDQPRAVWMKKALAAAGIDPRQWVPTAGFKHNEQTFLKVYRYYESLYLADNRLKWAAMAKLAGGEVYRGYRDQILPNLKFGAVLKSGRRDTYTLLDLAGDAYHHYAATLDIRLLQMQKAIFMDLAWQHQAYREGGIRAIAAARARGEIDDALLRAWQDIDSGEPSRVNAGNKELLRREQFEVLQGGVGGKGFYRLIQDIPDNDLIPEAMSDEARSPIPGGKPFAAVVKGGDITKFKDRWAWLERDMIPAFERLDAATLRDLVQTPLADLAAR